MAIRTGTFPFLCYVTFLKCSSSYVILPCEIKIKLYLDTGPAAARPAAASDAHSVFTTVFAVVAFEAAAEAEAAPPPSAAAPAAAGSVSDQKISPIMIFKR